MKLLHFQPILAGMLLFSCSQSDDPNLNTIPETSATPIKVQLSSEMAATRGQVNTTVLVNNTGNTFILDVWTDGTGPVHCISANTYTCSQDSKTGNYIWNGTDSYWLESGYLNFWATYPVSVSNRSSLSWPTPTSASFTYDMSSLSSGDNAATSSTDILLGYSHRQKPAAPEGLLEIELQHPLSSVIFQKGNFANGFDITRIGINGIHLTGNCAVTANSSTEQLSFVWTGTDALNSNTGLSQSVSLNELQTLSNEDLKNGSIPTGSKIFFVIPQSLGETASLSITVSNGKTSFTKTASLNGITWSAGAQYGYRINYDTQKLTVSTSVDGWVQKDTEYIEFE